jgi:hypothetical protein
MSDKPKPFAIVKLNNAKSIPFDSEDEMRLAYNTLAEKEIPVLILKYYPEIEQYKALEHY